MTERNVFIYKINLPLVIKIGSDDEPISQTSINACPLFRGHKMSNNLTWQWNDRWNIKWTEHDIDILYLNEFIFFSLLSFQENYCNALIDKWKIYDTECRSLLPWSNYLLNRNLNKRKGSKLIINTLCFIHCESININNEPNNECAWQES